MSAPDDNTLPSLVKASSGDETTDFKDEELEILCDKMRSSLEVKDRKYHLQTFKKSFLGTDAVNYLRSDAAGNMSDEDAVQVGQLMLELGLFRHVTGDHPFKDADLFYRFASDEPNHGGRVTNAEGVKLSWGQLGSSLFPAGDGGGVGGSSSGAGKQSDLSGVVSHDEDLQSSLQHINVSPLDEHNVELLDNVHPPAWKDPETADDNVYNLVALGAGSGGLVSAAGAAGVGAKVALIEDHLLGGDCLNVGCVPSKALIAAAKAAHMMTTGGAEYGVTAENVTIDFAKVMERMRKIRAGISHHDSAERFSKDLGIDVFLGRGTFTGPNTIEVNGKTLKFKKAVVATGGTAALPPIPGLAEAPYLTNNSIFNLTTLPPRMLVIGGGPIGLELAQAMRRFGSEVTVLVRSDQIMPKEDEDAARIVQEQLLKDGIKFNFYLKFDKVETVVGQQGAAVGDRMTTVADVMRVTCRQGGPDGEEEKEVVFEAEALLVATGRKPNVQGIGLEAAGVKYDTRNGVEVNDQLQTSNKAIFAVGDCCTPFQFTHVSDFMARIVIRNALFFGKGKFSSLLIPWATYTEPEVAHVGLYPRDLDAQGIKYDTYTKQLADVDRAICEGDTSGFVKVHVKAGSDTLLGATIVGASAGDLISELSVAMQNGIGIGKLAAVIHPYPTTAEALRQVGDLYNKTRLTPTVKGLFRNLMKIQRR